MTIYSRIISVVLIDDSLINLLVEEPDVHVGIQVAILVSVLLVPFSIALVVFSIADVAVAIPL